jgi:eukaryotic-like serine/threonine-protein kinase
MMLEAPATIEPCLSQNQLAELLSDEPNGSTSSRLEDHLESCAKCQSALLELAGTVDLSPLSAGTVTSNGDSDATIEEPRADFLARLAKMALHEPGKPTVPQQLEAITAGLKLPGIDILEQIGRGSSADVYLARQKGINRLIALKVVPAEKLENQQDLERARRGVETVARLQHPNIIQVHHVGRHDRWFFGTLEYMEAGSLRSRLTGSPWEWKPAAELMVTLARAAAFIHAQGFVHRDLKPANILFKADGTPKLADFGLARSFAEDSNLTLDGEALGTPRYMAPEQAMGKHNLGPAIDVYALGAILYELLTGRPPFQGVSKLDTLYQVVHLPPVPLGRLQPGVPRDLAQICMRCLEKVPEARYGSAGELADDLERVLQARPIRPKPFGWFWRIRGIVNEHPFVTFITGILMLVAILEVIAIASLWVEMHDSSRFNQYQQGYNAQINSLASQLNQTQADLAATALDLAEYEIKAGNKEKARLLLDKVPKNLQDSRWGKLRAQCPTPDVQVTLPK